MPATLDQVQGVLKDLSDRIAAMPKAMTEEQVKTLTSAVLMQVLADENSEVYRKMRFAKAPTALLGTKYARWNLGIADVEFLYDLQSSLRGQRRVDGPGAYQGPSTELEGVFHEISEAYYLPEEEVKRIDRVAIDNVFPRITKATGRQLEAQLKTTYESMDAAESGYGSQLIGAQYVGELWEAARRESRVFNLIDSFEMTAPTAYLPVEVDIPEMSFVGETTTWDPGAVYTTVKTGSQRVAVTAGKFVIHQMWSGELEEDSIIPFIPFLRRQAALGLAHYSDSLVLNGDTTAGATNNINLCDSTPAATKHYLALDGIRHVGIVDNTANQKDMKGGPVTFSGLRGSLARMVDMTYLCDWGHPADPSDVVYVAELTTCDKIAELDEVITVDKFGPNATVLTGQQGKIGLNPLIGSIAMAKTDATGRVSNTGGNNVFGAVACFNRRGFKVGWRRRVKLETERLPATDTTRLVYSLRLGMGRFSPTGASSGIESADTIFNIGL
jgi:hypothetical protein